MTTVSIYRLLNQRAVVSWMLLILATLLLFALGVDHGAGAIVVILILGIAAGKIRLVGLDFMELRDAPIKLRAVFEIYCLALWALLSALYVM